jgi:urease accessory protein
MLRADKIIPAGQWSGAPADTVVLDFDDRYRRRMAMTGVGGLAFLLDLEEAAMLRGGDGLSLEDGRIVEVVAAPEPLAEIRVADGLGLARIAWHLGNRHLPTEILAKALRIRRDPVIEAMAKGLAARVVAVEAPFNPEGGAYVKPEKGARERHSERDDRHHHLRPHGPAEDREHERLNDRDRNAHDHGSGHTHHRHHGDEHESGGHNSRQADGGAPLPLLVWLSPGFPVGAFAYSHGFEWAVEAGDVVDARSLEAWLADLIEFGAPRSDAILFSAAFRCAKAGDWPALIEANALAVALCVSGERRLETTAQGAAFVAAARAAWDCEPLRRLDEEAGRPIAYPIAVAAAVSGHKLPLEASLEAFVLAQISNLVSASLRLGPIGQSEGQKILAALLPRIRVLARDAQGASLDDLGGAAFRSDIAAMRHETQYSRLFRS